MFVIARGFFSSLIIGRPVGFPTEKHVSSSNKPKAGLKHRAEQSYFRVQGTKLLFEESERNSSFESNSAASVAFGIYFITRVGKILNETTFLNIFHEIMN